MIEVKLWLFIAMIVGLFAGGLVIDFQNKKIKLLKKKLKKDEKSIQQ
jgi:uncharacterized membrane-anchored protein YhcB (DUF1043 family)